VIAEVLAEARIGKNRISVSLGARVR